MLCATRELGVIRDDHATPARGHDLVSIEREASEATDQTNGAAIESRAEVGRAERFGCVFNDRDAIPITRLDEASDVRGVPEDMNDLDRLRHRFARTISA